MSRKQFKKAFFLYGQKYTFIPLVWDNIHCESNKAKQDFQVGKVQ